MTEVYEIKLKDGFTSPLSGLESKMNKFESSVGGLQGAFSNLGQTIFGVFGGNLLSGGVQGILSGIKDLAVESVKVAREFTNMKDAIAFSSGGDAEKNLKFLDDTINRLGLDINSTYKGFKTFQGALMGTSLEGDKGREIFTAVSEAASVMKLSAEQTEGSFLALGQMISKGNVSAEELRGQLGERLPGAFQIFARSLGVSTSKLGDMLKKGEVLAEDALPKFAAELRKTFSPGVASAQNTFNANLNRFNNWILSSKKSLGEGLIPALNEFVTVIPKLDFTPLLLTFQQLKGEVFGVFNELSKLFDLFGVHLSTLEKFTLALRYMSYLFRVAFTPIRFAIFAFTELMVLVRNSVDIFKGLGNVIAGLFTKDFAQMAKGLEQITVGWEKFLSEASSKAGEFLNNEKQGWKSIFSPLSDSESGTSAQDGYPGSTSGASGKMTTADKAKEAGVEKIHSGTRNITININKLIETVKFEKVTGQSEAQLMDTIKRTLLTAVNDVNIVAQ